MHSYVACGFGISSTILLPALALGTSSPEVCVRLGEASESAPRSVTSATPESVDLIYGNAGSMSTRLGREMVLFPSAQLGTAWLHTLATGPGLGLVALQRGLLVLHASAVAVGGAAVAFVGVPEQGKSSTAAALCMRGHNILSDDVLAVQLNGAGAGAWLSMSQLNVWPPTAAACLGEGWQSLPRLAEGTEKRALRTDGVSPLTPLPLRCIYVLDVGESISAEPIGVRAACLELLRHTYAAGLLRAMGVAGDNLRQCGQLAQRVPVYRLRRPFRLESLPDVAQWLEEQCGL